MDALRAGEVTEAAARGPIAARAVAPLAIEEAAGELERVGGERREVGVARAGAVVAMMVYDYRMRVGES